MCRCFPYQVLWPNLNYIRWIDRTSTTFNKYRYEFWKKFPASVFCINKNNNPPCCICFKKKNGQRKKNQYFLGPKIQSLKIYWSTMYGFTYWSMAHEQPVGNNCDNANPIFTRTLNKKMNFITLLAGKLGMYTLTNSVGPDERFHRIWHLWSLWYALTENTEILKERNTMLFGYFIALIDWSNWRDDSLSKEIVK